MTTQAVVELTNVTMRYNVGDDVVDALSEVTLSISAGERVAIVGRSGSGKSTLLNVIGALERPAAGEVQIAGESLASRSDNELAAMRNTQLGFVFQHHHLLPQCTAIENVLVPTLVTRGVNRTAVRQRAEQLLERVGMKDRMRHRPGQLSGGELQRVGLVRALINKPRIVLADEPTGSLDDRTTDEIIGLLLELQADESFTLIMVTHDRDLANRMDRVITLSDGKVAGDTGQASNAQAAASS